MAKQSGIHQIKGKIGEHSYYRQTGVSGGLIRSINQGLSARVKADAAYANTRLNNQEFGAAANTAALLGQMVTPKFRPMILPFSQSKMAKEVLRLARENVENWGQRTIDDSQTAQLAEVLSAQSKRRYSDFVSVDVQFTSDDEFDAVGSWTAEQASLMASLGITHVSMVATAFNLATGQWNMMGNQMMTGYLEKVASENVFAQAVVTAGTPYENNESFDIPAFIPAPNHASHQIVVFVVMPIRQINSVNSILQEYCSFTAVALPARS